MVGGISFSQGLISGLDFGAVVDAIIDAERAPVRVLERRIDTFERAKGRFDSLGSLLGDFESALEALKSGSGIGAKTATINAEDPPFSVSTNTTADAGVYDVTITALAEANRYRSETFDDRFSPLVSDGTITIQSGSNEAITIDVSAANGNNSLQAIAESINSADKGVSASIINDGDEEILVVRSEKTGTENALTITDTTNLNLAANEIQAAADAQITIDGIAITSSTNVVADAIQGVTLDLSGTTTGALELTVENDIEGAKQALNDFVEAYNAVNDFFAQEFSGAGGASSSLTNGATLRNIQRSVQSVITGSVTGIPEGKLDSLAELGVVVADRSGRLEFKESDFDTIVEQGRFDEARAVLESTGSTSDPSVIFVAAGPNTVAGTYDITVTNAPERATVQVPFGGPLAADTTLNIDLNGTAIDVVLTAGDDATVAATKVNAALEQAGISATARESGGDLEIYSDNYGSDQTLTVSAGGNVLADTGEDVAGTINGVAATGNGQELTGADGTDVEGLSVKIFATEASVTAKGGDFGSVGYSEGVIDASLGLIDQLSDPFEGTLKSVTDGFTESIETMQARIERFEERLARREELLLLQFSTAEQAISELQLFQSSLQSSLG